MTARTWHKGPPPHVGWWNASVGMSLMAWRWWDGSHWSDFSLDTESAERAGAHAVIRSTERWPIEWTDYWPENARVPRVDPRQPEQKPNYVCDRITLEYKALVLLQEASRLGFNLTIENKPLKPLAMGHTMSAVCVWPKRGAA